MTARRTTWKGRKGAGERLENKTGTRAKSLSEECRFLKGVGPVRAERLRRLGIETLEDVVTHFPRAYYDRRSLSRVADLKPGEDSTFLGRILTVAARSGRRRRSVITAAVGDDTGIVQVVWFNQPYLAKHLKPGTDLVVTGELSYFRGARQIVNPEFEALGEGLDDELLHTGRIVPVYPLTRGISQRFLRELVARTLDDWGGAIYENLPAPLVASEGLSSRLDALRGIHFPADGPEQERAVVRLKLEELFFLQLVFSLQRLGRSGRRARKRFSGGFSLEKRFLESLPFGLTGAQKKVLDDIHRDLSGEEGMHRLLQGDVGSGKTIVAGAAMLAAVESGMQAALMVPTEILASQHARTLSAYFAPLGVGVELLVGSLKPPEKRRIRGEIVRGGAPVVVGTHALIQEGIEFKNLGLVVVDEQHRFGVRQRAALLGKDGGPHMLVMTATPIPRTLALTAYADLDLSVIDEFPPGRAEVKTRVVPPEKREAMYEFVRSEAEKGLQSYLLYPVIDETEKMDVEAAMSAYVELSAGTFAGVPVGLLHGRMGYAEKETVMNDFHAGRVKLLVTTTVVEVGVHVPQATIMVIHHPERFGLSQVHQLRGRVGRGGRAGHCFLLLGEGVSQSARERLDVLTRVSDGFRIAEEDLRIRGPGEFFGVRQHGVPGLRIANPLSDQRLVETTRRYVKDLLRSDPRLESPDGAACRRYLRDMGADSVGSAVG
jgi:ATP-dependent DNA helicase RecG